MSICGGNEIAFCEDKAKILIGLAAFADLGIVAKEHVELPDVVPYYEKSD